MFDGWNPAAGLSVKWRMRPPMPVSGGGAWGNSPLNSDARALPAIRPVAADST